MTAKALATLSAIAKMWGRELEARDRRPCSDHCWGRRVRGSPDIEWMRSYLASMSIEPAAATVDGRLWPLTPTLSP
jgi:hypothetical protein